MSYNPNSPPVGGDVANEYWNIARGDDVPNEPTPVESSFQEICLAEEDDLISGQLRDFTRRYGILTPSGDGHWRDAAGMLWEPLDPTSITTMLFGGMRPVVWNKYTND